MSEGIEVTKAMKQAGVYRWDLEKQDPLGDFASALARVYQAMKAAEPACVWKEDWALAQHNTTCGTFIDHDLILNGLPLEHCPNCGRRVEVRG